MKHVVTTKIYLTEDNKSYMLLILSPSLTDHHQGCRFLKVPVCCKSAVESVKHSIKFLFLWTYRLINWSQGHRFFHLRKGHIERGRHSLCLVHTCTLYLCIYIYIYMYWLLCICAEEASILQHIFVIRSQKSYFKRRASGCAPCQVWSVQLKVVCHFALPEALWHLFSAGVI